MIILNMLNNLNKYGIIPSTGKQNILLLKQNKQLIDEIKIMKSKLSHEAYTSANIFYRKIIKEVNIRLFRILLREQYYNNLDNNLNINFLFDYDDNNNTNITFFQQIIFDKKIRNIVKHTVLKKFIMEDEDFEALFNLLIEKLDKLVLTDPTRETRRCEIIDGLLARRAEFIDLAKRFTGGGNNILVGGAITNLVNLFVISALVINDPQITELCKKCITVIDKSNSDNIKKKIDEIIDDNKITIKDKGLYEPYITGAENIQKEQIDVYIQDNRNDNYAKSKYITNFIKLIIHSKNDEYITEVNKLKIIIEKKEQNLDIENYIEEEKEIKIDKKINKLNDILAKDKIDDVICNLESININENPLILELMNGEFYPIDSSNFDKIKLWLRQYSKSIDSHTIETIGNGKKDSARIIFGTYIQLIKSDLGKGQIIKLEYIKYEKKWQFLNLKLNKWEDWIEPFMDNIILISIIKATLDYQNNIIAKEKKNITIDTKYGCFTATLFVPTNVYVLMNKDKSEIGYYETGKEIYYVQTKIFENDKNLVINFQDTTCPNVETRSFDRANLDSINLNDLLECEKIDNVLIKLEKIDVSKQNLYFYLEDKTRLICDVELFGKILCFLRQYNNSIKNHTIETIGNGKKGSARIIFGAFIQLIHNDSGLGYIYEMKNIRKNSVLQEFFNGHWIPIRAPEPESKDINYDTSIFISLIKSTLDYQNIKTIEEKNITIDTEQGCFNGKLYLPSNVYILKKNRTYAGWHYGEIGWYIQGNDIHFAQIKHLYDYMYMTNPPLETR